MKRAALVWLAAIMLVQDVKAQDALNGKRLYFDVGRLRDAGSSCVDCHFALPGLFGIGRAANDPARIQQAVNSIPQMNALRGRLTAADYADLAAYIGQPNVPSPELRVSTSGASNDRIDFGQVAAGASAAGQMRLANGGALPLRLTSLPQVVGEHALDFSIVTGSSCSSTAAQQGALGPGTSCVVELRFAPPPGAAGPRRAAVRIEHDWIGGQAAVALLGEAQPTGNPAAPPIGSGSGSGSGSGGGGALASDALGSLGLPALLVALLAARTARRANTNARRLQ
jgi:hypothetical protein